MVFPYVLCNFILTFFIPVKVILYTLNLQQKEFYVINVINIEKYYLMALMLMQYKNTLI